jgi:hypothetical protein
MLSIGNNQMICRFWQDLIRRRVERQLDNRRRRRQREVSLLRSPTEKCVARRSHEKVRIIGSRD